MALETVIAIGIVIFLLFYLAFRIENESNGFQLLKLLFIMFGLGMIILIPKTNIESDRQVCEVLLVNESNVGGNVTQEQTILNPAVFLTGASCNVTYDEGGTIAMTENTTGEYFFEVKSEGFVLGNATHDWNVTCNIGTNPQITATDTLFINGTFFDANVTASFLIDTKTEFDQGTYDSTNYNSTQGGIVIV